MIAGPVLVDTGPLVALLVGRDQFHETCSRQIQEISAPLYSCWPVVTEAAYLLRRYRVGLDALLSRIELRRVELLPLGPEDAPGIAGILRRFHDQGFDLADACLMHLAERDGIRHVFTLDQRHFRVFRKMDGSALQLHPASIS